MNDPAQEAARRATTQAHGFERPKIPALALASAREALNPIRELHRPVNAHGTGRIVCGVCWDSMSDYMRWPCATARLVYSEEELS